MLDAEGSDHPGRHHRHRQTYAEKSDQRHAEYDLLELKAEQQNSDRCRAWDQAAGQPEDDDLPGRDTAILKAAAYVIGVSAFVRVHMLAVLDQPEAAGFVMAVIMLDKCNIIIFGLTGGLIPCPAAITVLLLCLQLKQIILGVALVALFSIGLAVTMVSAGVIASLSVKHIQTRWSGFSVVARRAPYASSGLMVLIALYMGISGLIALS